MDNKGKTFGDLFVNSNDNEEGIRHSSFDDIFKNSKISYFDQDNTSTDDKSDSVESRNVSFDSEIEKNLEEVKEDNKDVSENPESNVFLDFEDTAEKQQEFSSLIEKNSPQKSILENNLTEKVEEVVETSESPFFSDDGIKEDTINNHQDNPLFLSTLNLIENENKEKKVSVVDPEKSRHFHVKVVRKKEPLFKVIIGILSYALFIWLLLIGITLLIYVLDIKIRASKGDYSSPTYNAYVVLTGSMLPDIQVYDVVVTKKVDASSLNVGDIITFSSADSRFLNTIITHRIIKKNYNAELKEYSFQTKGDNNNVADSALVPQNRIFGKVILKIPKLGYLQEFLATDGGWIIVILIPCLAVISYDIVKLIKGLRRKKYKNIKVQK